MYHCKAPFFAARHTDNGASLPNTVLDAWEDIYDPEFPDVGELKNAAHLTLRIASFWDVFVIVKAKEVPLKGGNAVASMYFEYMLLDGEARASSSHSVVDKSCLVPSKAFAISARGSVLAKFPLLRELIMDISSLKSRDIARICYKHSSILRLKHIRRVDFCSERRFWYETKQTHISSENRSIASLLLRWRQQRID
ncbi:hypothetical protein CPB83DRAFT_884227 [Crepidotus variabilis]|uniref:Uncharacterized protein n=1 Tax=Crepidotus variabilis TaxID=179855 RepID=A0A9P6JNJ1_9AGAR|nr:hypothetical protein CPB83DRAFT_884227 [Crepidotus variabilis]